MNLTRFALFLVTGCVLLLNPLAAQTPAPWTPSGQFSADQIITTKDGTTITSKIYVDTGKIRTETSANGTNMVSIALPDQKKMYTVIVDQHIVMEMPLTGARAQQMTAAAGGGGAKFELVGPDAVDGTPCTKYKMTVGNDPKVFFWWINPATNAPVKMASEDGSFSLSWKNYKTGPQDPSLFQPPAGYQVMQLPAGLNVPGGAAPSGQ